MHKAIHFLTRKEILFLILTILVGGSSVFVSFSLAATISNPAPAADGVDHQWTPNGVASSTHYTTVDEKTCNGLTDYVYATVIGSRDSYKVNLNSIPNGYTITAIDITPCASFHSKGFGAPKLNVFYRFNGTASADAGNYALTGVTPKNLAATKFNTLSLVKDATSQLEVGVALTGFGDKGARVSRVAVRLTTTPPPPATLSVKFNTDYTGLRNDHYVLGGIEKHLAGRIQLAATGDDVQLTQLALKAISKNTPANVHDTFDSITLYEDAAMTKPLVTKPVVKGKILLGNLNYLIPKGTTQFLYIGVNLNSIGVADSGIASSNVNLSFGLLDTDTKASSASSNAPVLARNVVVTENVYSKSMTSVGSQVTSVVSNFSGGDLAGGEQVVFSFAVTADAGANTDDSGDTLATYLTRLKLQLSTDLTMVTGTKLCRVNTGSSCITLRQVTPINATRHATMLQTANDGFVDMTDFVNSDDERINSGETVFYEIRATLSNVTDRYIQGSVQDVHTSGIVWGYDLNHDSILDFTFTDLKKMEPRPATYPDIVGSVLN